MVIGTGTANASYSGQVSGGQSPAVPGSSTSSSFPDSVVHPVPIVPVPPAGGGAIRQAQAGGPIWYPDYNSQQHDLLTSERVLVSGGHTSSQKLTPGYGSRRIPKLGSRYHECGWVLFMIACPEDLNHYKRYAKESCFRAACPVCWPVWAAREAIRAAERIRGYKQAFERYNDARHFSFSPPPYSIDNLNDLMSEARSVMKIAGVEAVAAIPHPYRLVSSNRDAIPTGSWTNRYVEVLEKGSWRDHVRMSPHVHALAYGPLMDSKQFQKETGWVYRNHDANNHTRNLTSTLYYLLTHAWVSGNNMSVRYWFGLNNHTLGRIELEPEYKTETCPRCKSDCVDVDLKQDPDTLELVPAVADLHLCPVHRKKVRRWEYIERLSIKRKS